ncbi:MAG TPA: tRNA (adenosine(37)-N6)-threonylcarbamoyltransferase complex ATPase subunit type 1 TsaE [Dissulfurispiraceae bacterium]|nr:tRNA (adenosine(37)-N6)-threonylcarbamoyltransferase complex ATPase subunit type 1 TsaE [Dissulfurispiraceae bacterium]
MIESRVTTNSPEDTMALGRRIGQALRSRVGGAAVCLSGDLGAGKTVFVKGLAAAFGIPEREVGSASFIVIAEYETTPRFVHVDLYRIEYSSDLDELGLWEYIGDDAVVVIEWAERLAEQPRNAVQIYLESLSETEREIRIRDEDHWDNQQAAS